MGVKALRKIQLGQETTAGSAVAATQMWRGMGVIADERDVQFPNEDIGYLSGVDRSYISQVLASISFDETESTFELLPYILSAGIADTTTGVACGDATTTGYKYAYALPTDSANSLQYYTIEAGDDEQAQEMEYSFVTDFTLSGSAGEAWMVSANWQGRQASDTTFAGALSVPTVSEMLFSKSKLYIDDAGGTIGTTQVTSTLLSATLNVNTGWVPRFTADGELYYTYVQSTDPEVTLDMTFEFNSDAVTERGNWEDETARLVRLECEGDSLTGTGTTSTTTYTFTKQSMIIDLAGKWDNFEPIAEEDGNDIISCSLRARYNATAAQFADIVIANDSSSLT